MMPTNNDDNDQGDSDDGIRDLVNLSHQQNHHRQLTAGEPVSGDMQFEPVYFQTEIITSRRQLKSVGQSFKVLLALLRWKAKIPRQRFAEVSASFVALALRPYFSRVWVMQEVFLAPRISLCCGRHHQSMATLHGLANAIQKLSAFVFISLGLLTKLFGQKHFLGMIFHGVSLGSTMRLDFPFERTPLLGRMLPLHLFTFMEQFDKIDRGPRMIIALSSTHTDSKRLMRLHEAIMKMMHLDCQDDRDRIYGTLGCIDWEGFTPIMPDYTITNYRLATALLQSQPSRDCKLNILMAPVGRPECRRLPHGPDVSHTELAMDLARTLRISKQDAEVIAGLRLRKAIDTKAPNVLSEPNSPMPVL